MVLYGCCRCYDGGYEIQKEEEEDINEEIGSV